MANAAKIPDDDRTNVTILLVGDAGCGKSTFLSSLKMAQPRPPNDNNPAPSARTANEANGIVPLRDSDQPFIYDIRFSRRSFTLEFYDTTNPNQHWTMLQPDIVVLAFDISNRETLAGLRVWRNDITRYFQHGYGERIPVMMLGLKRDLRVENEDTIYPQETYNLAQQLRCDRYAECSAVTRELLAETFEDISRMAAMTSSTVGGQSDGGCIVC